MNMKNEIDHTINVAKQAARGRSDMPPSSDWKPPIPFFTHDLPEFPSSTLSIWQQQWVEAEAEATQTPVGLAGLLVLCVTGTAVARKVEIQIREGWQEPLNLYGIVGLDPGNRKSAVFRDATHPIEEQEKAEANAMKDELIKAKTNRDILEAQLAHSKKAAAKAKEETKREEWKEIALRLAIQLEETPTLVEPRYIADDCTPEKLGSLLATHKSRIGILSAEGDIFDTIAGRYNKGQPNLGVFLKAHSGDDIRVDRVGRPSEFVKNPALTLALTVQLSVIQGLASKPDFKGRGLLARILYVLPESPMGRRKTSPSSIPTKIKITYYENTITMLTLPWREDFEPHVIKVSGEGLRIFNAFHEEIERKLSRFGELGNMQDWGGKLVGAIARVAGNLHLAEHVDDPSPWDILLSEATMAKAIQLGDYFISHAKAAYAEMGADPATEDAKHILKWIERHGATYVTKRDIHQGAKNRFRYINKLEPGLKMLIDHEYIRERDKNTDTKPGPGHPPSPIFDVNPAILSQKINNEIYEDNEDKDIKLKIHNPLIDTIEILSSKFPLSSEQGEVPEKGGPL